MLAATPLCNMHAYEPWWANLTAHACTNLVSAADIPSRRLLGDANQGKSCTTLPALSRNLSIIRQNKAFYENTE